MDITSNSFLVITLNMNGQMRTQLLYMLCLRQHITLCQQIMD